MIRDLLLVLWFLLPAALANAAPVFANKVPGLNRWTARMDGGLVFRGKALFGSHKTWRGLVSGMVMSTVVLTLQQYAVAHVGWAAYVASPIPYAALPVWLLGPLIGFGALGGDAIESFFKRQRDINPGKAWIPWDQTDYVIGAIVVSLPFVRLSLLQYGLALILWFTLHIIASYIGYCLKLKDSRI